MSAIDFSELHTGIPMDKVVIFDTETTGTKPYEGDEIVSIAICDAYGTILFSSLVRPTHHQTWPEAQQIHGISPAQVKNAPTIEQITPQLHEILTEDKLFVGYNITFDIQMLHAAGVFTELPGRSFDVMREYATVHGSRPRRYGESGYLWSKLSECASYYGYHFDAHDSRADVQATAFCYRSLLCDSVYLTSKIETLTPKTTSIALTQTQKTSASIETLIKEEKTVICEAELRLMTISRGNHAGQQRYSCYVDDLNVGNLSIQKMDLLADYHGFDEGEWPDHLPCLVQMTKENGRARSAIGFSHKDFSSSTDDLYAQAAKARGALRKSLPKRPPRPSQPLAPTPSQTSSSSRRYFDKDTTDNPEQATTGKISCLSVLIFIFGIWQIIVAFHDSDIGQGIAGLILIFCATKFPRKGSDQP